MTSPVSTENAEQASPAAALRPRRLRSKIVAGLAITLMVSFVLTRPRHDTTFRAQGPPQPTPVAGDLIDLSAEDFEAVLVGLRGTPVIVNIWASWCVPCRTETPLLERTWKAHGDEVAIIGVASKDVRRSSLAFMDEFEVSYPNLFDATGGIRAMLELRGFPTSYVFDANGTLRSTILGGLTEQKLAAVLDDLGR